MAQAEAIAVSSLDDSTHLAGSAAATAAATDASSARTAALAELFSLISEDDFVYEQECVRNPYHLKNWTFYLEHKANSRDSYRGLVFIYERALQLFPGSYKLWKAYLDLRVSHVLQAPPDETTGMLKRKRALSDPEWQEVNGTFERSLVLCNKFPMVWKLYCHFLMHQPRPTLTRHTFDRALKALPITQHYIIWELYLKFAERCGGETAVRVYRRYLRLEGADAAEDYVDLLLNKIEPPRYAEAARVMAAVLEDPKFVSRKGKTVFQLWTDFCELVCDHADEVDAPTSDSLLGTSSLNTKGSNARAGGGVGLVEVLDVDKVIRSGIARFTDQVGRLWNALARWRVARGEFDRAADVYEEAMGRVKTVRDFSMVFDAYAEFEESIIAARMESIAERDADGTSAEEAAEQDLDLDMRLARLERLMRRRPFLVSDVVLRQNPHSVHEWERRVALHKERGDDAAAVATYQEAVATIAPKKAAGRLHLLWANFAKFYEDRDDVAGARAVFERGVGVPFRSVDDLAELYCQWAEMELRRRDFAAALEVMGVATRPPRVTKGMPPLSLIRYQDETLPPQTRLFKSMKLWSFYVDLEESIGTVEGTKAVYDRIMDLKIATPQIILNCAAFLEEQKRFEESYTVYERGIELFGYPIAFEIWNVYLQRFVARHGSTKLERARDLFEHAVDKCPPKFAKVLYLMYAKLEEDHGLARHAMKIYDRATRAVGDEDRFEVYSLYVAKAVSFFGLVAAREIYQRAIEALPDRQARDMCVRFAELEARLMEVDRARAVWSYGSQFADPRMDPAYWRLWQEFEVKHGNEDTFKEMLRIKRSVQAKYNTDVNFISAQLLAQRVGAELQDAAAAVGTAGAGAPADAMAALEARTRRVEAELDAEDGPVPAAPAAGSTRVVGFVSARARGTDGLPLDPAQRLRAEAALATEEAGGGAGTAVAENPDEIAIGDDDDDDDDDDEEQEDGGDGGGDGDGADAVDSGDDARGGGGGGGGVRRRPVPDAVFGGLKEVAEDSGGEATAAGAKRTAGDGGDGSVGGGGGARERFKRRR